jgi:squalene-hopene/tetraprenyl-beta-curcumene cyclase
MELLGYEPDHPLRARCMDSLRKLLRHREDGTTYCQPCLSPTWDTGWSIMALLHADEPAASKAAIERAMDWLLPRQILEATGDWAEGAKNPPQPGGWAFQYSNPYFPDIDDTAVIAGVLHLADRENRRLAERINRAADWMLGLQSRNGGFGAYDCDNHHYYINHIPFADHGAMLDPPTEDVSGRVLSCLGVMNREQDKPAIARCVEYLKSTQQDDGSWWGRWGTNYIYGTWSALAGLMQVGEDPQQPYVRRAVGWLLSRQNADGGWGETCDSYEDSGLRGTHGGQSIPEVTAWSILALLACGEVGSPAVARGIGYLVEAQAADGLWHHPFFNAPGFPRVFYIKYYGYSAYFPLWALTRYRTLAARASLS